MTPEKLRAWWSHRQGLDGRLQGASAATILEETGWARSVAGVGPYLTLRSRGGIGREAADAAVAKLEIHELPSARGCTYVLPASDFALGLTAGASFRDTDMRTAGKLGVTESEIANLCEAVERALETGALSPDEIREATGAASRSLGEEGKKKGLTTTLPIALGKLQASGVIRRVPIEGRLDQQRYKYTLWRPNPISSFTLTPEEVLVELAKRFFKWTGPATLTEFQNFAGIGVAASKKAVEPLQLEPLLSGGEVGESGGTTANRERGRIRNSESPYADLDSGGSRLLILPQDRDAFEQYKPPTNPQYQLVSSLDGISLFRRDISHLLDVADRSHKVLAEKKEAFLGGLTYLPNHAILDRGRLVGLWEFDTATDTIAWLSFIPKNKDLVAAVAETEKYIREDLGDARSFSLDSPKSRIPAINALRAGVG